MERELWNGEYYVHRFDPATQGAMAYGEGCLSAQLVGQWWADILGLGHLFDPERVRQTLASIHKYNFKKDIKGLHLTGRRFLREDEPGLLNCTWPKGAPPASPLLYSEEVHTGMEYAVAGAMLFEGMVDEALDIVAATRGRQDGRLRSPWNDVEYGDHYVRAMSSWTLLEAAAGYRYDAEAGRMAFAPRIGAEDFRCLFVASEGWGRYSQRLAGGAFHTELSAGLGAAHAPPARPGHRRSRRDGDPRRPDRARRRRVGRLGAHTPFRRAGHHRGRPGALGRGADKLDRRTSRAGPGPRSPSLPPTRTEQNGQITVIEVSKTVSSLYCPAAKGSRWIERVPRPKQRTPVRPHRGRGGC